jgi:hypothetical protein
MHLHATVVTLPNAQLFYRRCIAALMLTNRAAKYRLAGSYRSACGAPVYPQQHAALDAANGTP